MGLDFDQLYPGRFLKAGLLRGQDVTLTIAKVELETLEGDKKKETRGIISFAERPQQLTLNKTNGLCLKAMFGRDTGNWIGKRVTLYPTENTSDVGDDICIRVRGSPDISAPIEAEIKLARKKPRKVTLLKTGQPQQRQGKPAQRPQQSAAQQPAAPPSHDQQTGEVFDLPPGGEPPEDVVLPGQGTANG